MTSASFKNTQQQNADSKMINPLFISVSNKQKNIIE